MGARFHLTMFVDRGQVICDPRAKVSVVVVFAMLPAQYSSDAGLDHPTCEAPPGLDISLSEPLPLCAFFSLVSCSFAFLSSASKSSVIRHKRSLRPRLDRQHGAYYALGKTTLLV